MLAPAQAPLHPPSRRGAALAHLPQMCTATAPATTSSLPLLLILPSLRLRRWIRQVLPLPKSLPMPLHRRCR